MTQLLFDHNLSPKLTRKLLDIFPASSHVSLPGLEMASDKEIWEYARDNGYTIVTKDADFGDFSIVWGVPPQIIWIRKGNCSTNDIETILRANFETIREFSADHSLGVLTLY